MNAIEKQVYNRLKYHPKIKNMIVYLYQLIFSIMPRKNIVTNFKIYERQNFFFGFHDKSPWSYDNKYLLAHRFDCSNRLPAKTDFIQVGYFKGNGWDEFVMIDETNAWNWQTGSMLQWVGNSHDFIFNIYDKNIHRSKIFNINGIEKSHYDCPIAAVSSNGLYAVSYSFNRQKSSIGALAYGYATGHDQNKLVDLPKNEYLQLLDLSTGAVHKIISLHEIVQYKTDKTMKGAFHYFTHTLFSPNSKRLLFFHRWINNKNQEFTRMFSVFLSSDDLFLFPTSGMVSHVAWKNDKEILVYADIKGRSEYYVLNDQSDDYAVLDEEVFTENGHPSYSNEGLIITDTYPNRFRMQSLIQYNDISNQSQVLAKLKAPFSFRNGIKCDLHPRWDRFGRNICFDSAHTGKRALCTLKLDSSVV